MNFASTKLKIRNEKVTIQDAVSDHFIIEAEDGKLIDKSNFDMKAAVRSTFRYFSYMFIVTRNSRCQPISA